LAEALLYLYACARNKRNYTSDGLAVADGEEALQILDERLTRVGGASGVDVGADRKI
jgi:hypothetical protein